MRQVIPTLIGLLTATVTATPAPLYHLTDLHPLIAFGGSRSFANGINNGGVIAGSAATGSGEIHAYTFAGGSATDRHADVSLGGSHTEALSINETLEIVGQSFTAGGNPHAFFFGGSLVDLDPILGFGSGYSSAIGISGSGVIVGQAAIASTIDIHAYVLVGTVRTDLHSTLGFGGTFSSANGINDAGDLVGVATDPQGNEHGFLYRNGTVTDLAPLLSLGGSRTWVYDIDNNGRIVGQALTSTGESHAVLLDGNVLYDLTTLVPSGSGLNLVSARGINDSGQIVGIGEDAVGSPHAVLLTPLPEPSTLALSSIFFSALLAVKGKRSHRGR